MYLIDLPSVPFELQKQFETKLDPNPHDMLNIMNKPVFILTDLTVMSWAFSEGQSIRKSCVRDELEEIDYNTNLDNKHSWIVDVIMTSSPDLVHKSVVMDAPISDHFPVFTVLKMKHPKPTLQSLLTWSYKTTNSREANLYFFESQRRHQAW